MKNFKSIIIFLVATFLLIGGITLIANSIPSNDSYHYANIENTPIATSPVTPVKNSPNKTTTPATNTTPGYTLAQVTMHASSKSCWTIIQGNVYDLTSFINQHPGGPEFILSICGKDGTAAFENQHSGQRRPQNELTSFKIGTYKQ